MKEVKNTTFYIFQVYILSSQKNKMHIYAHFISLTITQRKEDDLKEKEKDLKFYLFVLNHKGELGICISIYLLALKQYELQKN